MRKLHIRAYNHLLAEQVSEKKTASGIVLVADNRPTIEAVIVQLPSRVSMTASEYGFGVGDTIIFDKLVPVGGLWVPVATEIELNGKKLLLVNTLYIIGTLEDVND